MNKIFLSFMVTFGLMTAALPASDGYPVPAEYIPLEKDYSEHFSCLVSVDPDNGIFKINNESEWLVLNAADERVIDHLRRWKEGHWIHFSPSSSLHIWHLEVENRSLGERFRIKVQLLAAPPLDQPTIRIEDIQILTSGHAFLQLSNGDSWLIPEEQVKFILTWAIGDPVLLEVIEDYDFGSGVFIIRDKLYIVNLGDGTPESVTGIILR